MKQKPSSRRKRSKMDRIGPENGIPTPEVWF
jgi:hypothetical protein